jgi:hypothetical protein
LSHRKGTGRFSQDHIQHLGNLSLKFLRLGGRVLRHKTKVSAI